MTRSFRLRAETRELGPKPGRKFDAYKTRKAASNPASCVTHERGLCPMVVAHKDPAPAGARGLGWLQLKNPHQDVHNHNPERQVAREIHRKLAGNGWAGDSFRRRDNGRPRGAYNDWTPSRALSRGSLSRPREGSRGFHHHLPDQGKIGGARIAPQGCGPASVSGFPVDTAITSSSVDPRYPRISRSAHTRRRLRSRTTPPSTRHSTPRTLSSPISYTSLVLDDQTRLELDPSYYQTRDANAFGVDRARRALVWIVWMMTILHGLGETTYCTVKSTAPQKW